jgi:PHD/YefM family antitoxin component YafN of YafNO toxin-antitoxin module
MTITTMSSREFNQDVGKAKRASLAGPVIITDRGHAAHVFLTMEEYERLSAAQGSILELLAMPEVAGMEFEPGKAKLSIKPAEFE